MHKHRKLNRERQHIYKQELQEIEQRVSSRPLVFEQVSQESARRAAETKYKTALKKAGLTEEEIQALDKEISTDIQP